VCLARAEMCYKAARWSIRARAHSSQAYTNKWRKQTRSLASCLHTSCTQGICKAALPRLNHTWSHFVQATPSSPQVACKVALTSTSLNQEISTPHARSLLLEMPHQAKRIIPKGDSHKACCSMLRIMQKKIPKPWRFARISAASNTVRPHCYSRAPLLTLDRSSCRDVGAQ
jgi:hypothetical protein